MIRISELKLRPDHTGQELRDQIKSVLRLGNEAFTYEIARQSIDARRKPELYYVYTVDVRVAREEAVARRAKNRKVGLVRQAEYCFPYASGMLPAPRTQEERPYIIGSGPAGLFCALMLARAGLRPVVLERGECVEERMRTVQAFWEGGKLNPCSNVQFGEGGAGTFSDGKLNTLIKDPTGRIRFVLRTFVEAGARPDILYRQKPHVGTDVLAEVVRHIRREIQDCGGELRFGHCLEGLERTPDGKLSLLIRSANGGTGREMARTLVLAIGHSSRDTLRMLFGFGLPMQAKPFAVGLRMEHPQAWINRAMYGENCPYELEAAPYKVTHKCGDGRGVYSFCMCPGGYVVNASSEPGRLAVNGMSYSSRDGENANSAIVVTVAPEDYGAGHPLDGVAFQERLEEAAYRCGGGKIPVQRYGDFKENRPTGHLGAVRPQTRGGYTLANLRSVLPEELNRPLIEGIEAFGRKIGRFSDEDALLSGVESRTSSPVRILRGESFQSRVPGIFPCGEGAGYAGGITSAAVDGIRVAEAVCREFAGIGDGAGTE